MPSNWRQATPMERSQWARWVEFYEGPLTRSVIAYHLAAGIAADTQTFLTGHGFTHPVVFTQQDELKVKSLLNAYNTVGRILIGVHSAKYGIRLEQGDIDVLAPPGMPKEDWQGDLYTLGAVPLIIWAVVVGVTLVGGLWAGSALMQSTADKEFIKYKKSILKADKAMMKKPPDVRRDWIKRRSDFEKEINKTKEDTGLLVNIFGEKGGAAIAAVAIGLIALVAMRFIPKSKAT